MKRILVVTTILAILTINVVVAQTTPVLNNQQLTGVALQAVTQYKELKEKHEELQSEVTDLKSRGAGNLDAEYVGMFDTQHCVLLKGQLIGMGYTLTEANEFVDPLAKKVKKAFRASASKGFKQAREAGQEFLEKIEELAKANDKRLDGLSDGVWRGRIERSKIFKATTFHYEKQVLPSGKEIQVRVVDGKLATQGQVTAAVVAAVAAVDKSLRTLIEESMAKQRAETGKAIGHVINLSVTLMGDTEVESDDEDLIALKKIYGEDWPK